MAEERKKRPAGSEPAEKPRPSAAATSKPEVELADPNAPVKPGKSNINLKAYPMMLDLGRMPYEGHYMEKGNGNHERNSEHRATEPDNVPSAPQPGRANVQPTETPVQGNWRPDPATPSPTRVELGGQADPGRDFSPRSFGDLTSKERERELAPEAPQRPKADVNLKAFPMMLDLGRNPYDIQRKMVKKGMKPMKRHVSDGPDGIPYNDLEPERPHGQPKETEAPNGGYPLAEMDGSEGKGADGHRTPNGKYYMGYINKRIRPHEGRPGTGPDGIPYDDTQPDRGLSQPNELPSLRTMNNGSALDGNGTDLHRDGNPNEGFRPRTDLFPGLGNGAYDTPKDWDDESAELDEFASGLDDVEASDGGAAKGIARGKDGGPATPSPTRVRLGRQADPWRDFSPRGFGNTAPIDESDRLAEFEHDVDNEDGEASRAFPRGALRGDSGNVAGGNGSDDADDGSQGNGSGASSDSGANGAANGADGSRGNSSGTDSGASGNADGGNGSGKADSSDGSSGSAGGGAPAGGNGGSENGNAANGGLAGNGGTGGNPVANGDGKRSAADEIMALDKDDPQYFSKLARILTEKPMTQEEVERRNRGAAASQAIAGLGNALNAIANVAFAGGAPSQTLPQLPNVDYSKLEDKAREQRKQYAASMMRGAQQDYAAYQQAKRDKAAADRWQQELKLKQDAAKAKADYDKAVLDLRKAKNADDKAIAEKKAQQAEKRLQQAAARLAEEQRSNRAREAETARHNKAMEGKGSAKEKKEKEKKFRTDFHLAGPYGRSRDYDMNKDGDVLEAWKLFKKHGLYKPDHGSNEKEPDTVDKMRNYMLTYDRWVKGSEGGWSRELEYNADGTPRNRKTNAAKAKNDSVNASASKPKQRPSTKPQKKSDYASGLVIE